MTNAVKNVVLFTQELIKPNKILEEKNHKYQGIPEVSHKISSHDYTSVKIIYQKRL